MIHIPLWLAALLGMVSLTLAAGAIMVLALQQKSKPKSPRMPEEWALTGRAVFSTSERRLFRLLRETLGQHVILAKLPMVRFCQPIDFGRTRYWYDLLGSNYVSFAICAPNGRVLAAIDIDKDRHGDEATHLRRSMKIKRAVLKSCRIRYLRVPAGATLTESDIKLLVSPARGFFDENPLKPSSLDSMMDTEMDAPEEGKLATLTAETTARLVRARESLASTVASRRAQRKNLWAESSMFQDSFFALDSRLQESGLDEGPATVQPKLTEEAAVSLQPAAEPIRPPREAEPTSSEPDPANSTAEGTDTSTPAAAEQAEPAPITLQPESATRPPETRSKKFKSGRHGRRQPPVVNVTLEDAVPSEHLHKIVQLDSDEARHVAGQP